MRTTVNAILETASAKTQNANSSMCRRENLSSVTSVQPSFLERDASYQISVRSTNDCSQGLILVDITLNRRCTNEKERSFFVAV